jgi:phage host-nuclease inhibitor protein Gam
MATAVLSDAGARPQVAERLRRMARMQSRLDSLCAELERDLDGVRQRYEGRISALRGRLTALTDELEALCRSRRDDVFEGGGKCYCTAHGEVAFRRAEAALHVRDGLSDAAVCRLLRRNRLARFVRTKEGPDRRAIRKALDEGEVDGARLGRCGLVLVDLPDHFRCTVGRPGGRRVR